MNAPLVAVGGCSIERVERVQQHSMIVRLCRGNGSSCSQVCSYQHGSVGVVFIAHARCECRSARRCPFKRGDICVGDGDIAGRIRVVIGRRVCEAQQLCSEHASIVVGCTKTRITIDPS